MWSEPVPEALDSLIESLERAIPEDPASVEPVLERLSQLNLLLSRCEVPPEEFQKTRGAVDRALLRINTLLAGLIETRNEVGQALASFNSRRSAERDRVLGGPGRRLDVRY